MVDGILVGDGDLKISNICTIQKSKPGSIAFYYNKKYSNHLAASEASAIIAKEKDFIKKDGIIVQNPHLALITVLKHFKLETTVHKGVHGLILQVHGVLRGGLREWRSDEKKCSVGDRHEASKKVG